MTSIDCRSAVKSRALALPSVILPASLSRSAIGSSFCRNLSRLIAEVFNSSTESSRVSISPILTDGLNTHCLSKRAPIPVIVSSSTPKRECPAFPS
jgi:hypothetical protein